MRILCWLLGLFDDRFTETFASPPAPKPTECHLHGCCMPACAGEVLCEWHLVADRIGYYNPDSADGWEAP